LTKKLKPLPPRRSAPRFTSTEELPLILNVQDVAKALGISISKCYQLVNLEGFPRLAVSRRICVPKNSFLKWMESNTL
jgi:predicted DNA-binding transcriptional regulator AlpA